VKEAADVVGVLPDTAMHGSRLAKAWLQKELSAAA
jgi:hypothetical protein